MSSEISQRDLRMRSREIMDAVDRGESFVVTRSGREVAELAPIRRTRTFVPRVDFARLWSGTPVLDEQLLRSDIDAIVDPLVEDPFVR